MREIIEDKSANYFLKNARIIQTSMRELFETSPGWFPGTPRLGDPTFVAEAPARAKYDPPLASPLSPPPRLHRRPLLRLAAHPRPGHRSRMAQGRPGRGGLEPGVDAVRAVDPHLGGAPLRRPPGGLAVRAAALLSLLLELVS